MPRGHYLKPNDQCETIHEAIWFDTETDPVQITPLETGHKLFQGWAAYAHWRKVSGWSKPQWFKFETINEFWAWVFAHTRPKLKLYLFCHNTSFDLPVLDTFRILPDHGWKPHKIIADGPPTMIEVRKDKSTICILDTLNWWRMPLAALGKAIGLEKGNLPRRDAPADVWDTYNRRDVEIIMRTVQHWCDFLRDNDFGGFAQTLAAQAMRTYRHRFMTHKILIDAYDKALECARAAYHGGRVEAFHIGHLTGEYHLLDVNSMFPYVMSKHSFPSVYAYYTKRTDARDLKAMLRRYHICARVNVTVEENALPALRDGRLIFPVGTFDCSLSTPELQWVLEHGTINRVYDMSIYHRAPLFKSFVREMYARRLKAKSENDPVSTLLFKLLMNSLYGKWGQRGHVYDHEYDTDDTNPCTWREVDIDTGEVTHYKQMLGWVMKLKTDAESSGSHPAIAAHVTAYARMFLHQLITEAGHENVFYCDTDSLLVNSDGLDNLRHRMDNTDLGALKLEGTFGDCEIYGAKDYRFGCKVKTKGVRSSALWLTPDTVEQEKWSGLRGMIRNGNLSMPTTSVITKRLNRRYLKGTVCPDGGVEPFRL